MTSENFREISDDDNDEADHDQGDHEAGPAPEQPGGRDDGEYELESKSDEVHNVVPCGGIFNISAIHNHRIFELLSPCLIVHSELINIRICHQHQLVHNTVELIIICNCDSGFSDFS